jgi:photosystem II stability/assembly factor-like uncharacterized protein
MNRLFLPVVVAVFLVSLFLALESPHGRGPSTDDTPMPVGGLRATGAYQAARWYNDQRAYPTGSIPVDWRTKAELQLAKMSTERSVSAALTWAFAGPNNIGGRVRSIVAHPTDSNILFCGSVSGGLWKTTNAGGSWEPVNDFMPSLVVSCLRFDPTNTNVIYAGTGEGYFNTDALRGVGVLKSTDGGTSWTTLTGFTGSSATPPFPYYINDLYIRPDNSSIIYAATNAGVFRTTNAGTNWTFVKRGDLTYRATQFVADANSPQTIYVAFGNFSRDGIYKTTTGGATSGSWTKLTTGFPTTGYNRISMGISRSNPQVLYAVLTDSATYETYAIEKSTNGGANWTAVTVPTDAGGGTHLGGQGWYNNVVAVHPTNPNTVYIGGINIFRSTDAGATWAQLTSGYPPLVHPYAHVDQHAMSFDPNNASVMYFGNDGGMYKTTNGGSSFSSANSGLSVTQFYSGASHPTQDIFYGGTQDNGTLKTSGSLVWSEVFSGDGGVTHVDPVTPTTVYTEYTFMAIQKSTNSGSTFARIMSGIPTVGTKQGDGTSDRVAFIAPYAMDPTNPQVLVAGTYRVYRTTNGGALWTSISGDLTGSGAGSTFDPGSVISAIATIGDTIVVGTSGFDTLTSAPKVWVTTNKGTLWTNVTKSPLPKRFVSSIAIDRTDSRRVWVGFSGYNANSSLPGHLFATTDRGTTWSNVSGNLLDIPVNAIVVDPNNRLHIAVGTDLGVFETVNGGTNWTQQNTGLANVSVADLDLRADGILVAATHGRGVYKTTFTTEVTEVPAELPTAFALKQNYPNPFNPTTTIPFSIVAAGHVRLAVYDALGREVALVVDEDLAPGTYTAPFDASALASGVYFYRLSAAIGSQAPVSSETRKMLLVR